MLKILGRLIVFAVLLNFSCIGKKVITSPTAFQGECLQGLDFERSEDGFLADSLKVEDRLKENFDEKNPRFSYCNECGT